MNRRNTKKPPRASTMRMVIESLETRAMLAGVEPESWSAPGLAPAPLGTGVLSSSGIILTCSSSTPGSSGTSSPPAPAAGSGGSQSTGLALPSNSGSGTGSSSTGSGSSSSGGPALPSNSGSGTGSSSTGSGTSNSGGLALPSNSGSGAGSSHSGTGSTSDPNSPVLSSQYTGGSNAGGQGTGTNNGGTFSGSDLWLLYGTGLGAATSSSGASGGSSVNRLPLLSQYKDGSNAGGQGNGTGGTLTNADLWCLYWSGAGAGSSSGPANGSLANDPTISAQYTGGASGGLVFFVAGATGADAAGFGDQQGTTGSTALTLADGQSTVTTTPLVYQPSCDDGPGLVMAVWTGDDGDVQVVPIAEHLTEPDTASDSANVPRWSRYRTERERITSTVRVFEEPWTAPRRNDIEWMDAAGNRWLTDQGEISAYGPPPRAPTLSQVLEACGSVLASIGAARIVQKGSNSQTFAARNIRPPSLSPQDAGRSGAFNQAKRDSAIPTSQQPERVLPNLDRQGRIRPGRVYEYVVPGPYGTTKVIGIRDDAGGDFYGPGNPHNRGPHFNTESGGHYDY